MSYKVRKSTKDNRNYYRLTYFEWKEKIVTHHLSPQIKAMEPTLKEETSLLRRPIKTQAHRIPPAMSFKSRPVAQPVDPRLQEERASPAQGGGVEVLLWSFKTGPVAPVDTSD